MEKNLASRLSEVRKENNLSQEALAEKLGLSRQAISKWERGESAPDTANLIALSRIYGVSIDALLGNTEYNSLGDDKKASTENEQTESIKKDPAMKEKINESKNKTLLYPQLNSLMKKLPMFLIVPFVYVAIGLISNIWHPTWFMFFLIPMHLQMLHASYAKTRKSFFRRLPVLFVAVVLYLTLGFAFSLWKAGVVLILAVPVYYWAVSVFVKED